MQIKFFNAILATSAMAAALITTAAFGATVNVPFNFNVAGRNCPAGIYTVEKSKIDTSFVTLKSYDSRNTFTWTMAPGDPAPDDRHVILTFGELGPLHVLKTVQYQNLVRTHIDRNNRMSEQMPTRVVQGQ